MLIDNDTFSAMQIEIILGVWQISAKISYFSNLNI